MQDRSAQRLIRLLMELRAGNKIGSGVLAAMEKVPRELFLPEMFYDRAYEDSALPIGQGQTISQPSIVGVMTESLSLNPRMKVLEIGTGSGYQAAILSHLCRRVYTIERHKPLLEMARERFAALDLRNISTRIGDGVHGWPEVAPFERIIVTASAEREVPQKLLEQLDIGGVMVIPITSTRGTQNLYRITRDESGYQQEKLSAVRFVPLLPGDPMGKTEPADPFASLYKHLVRKETI